MRVGMLAVPPAPGTSPSASSGRAMTVSGAATTWCASAGTSMPAPMHAPWRCTWSRSAIWWARRAGLRVRRVTWAVAGSGNDPNSARSPPLQNDGPLPARCTAAIVSSAAARVSASASPSRSAAVTALWRRGRLSVTCRSSPTRSTSTGGSRSGGSPPSSRELRHAANSGPACSVEYTADSAARPSSIGRRSLARSRTASDAAATGKRATCSTSAASIGSSAPSSTSYGAGSTPATSTSSPSTTPTMTTGTEPGENPGAARPTVASTRSSGWPARTVAVSPARRGEQFGQVTRPHRALRPGDHGVVTLLSSRPPPRP